MKVEKFKSALIESLSAACKICISRVKPEIAGEQAYAVAIFCTSGCTSMGLALSTTDSLQRRNSREGQDDSRSFMNEMNAAEWGYVNHYSETFYATNRLIDEFYDCMFEGDFEDHKFSMNPPPAELDAFARATFVEVIAKALLLLKSEKIFAEQCFADDLLLGLQFADPGVDEANMMEEVSRGLNSTFWHAKVVRNCENLRSALSTE